MNEHCPNDAKRRYQFLQALKGELSIPVVHLIYKSGNNVGDLHYIWHGDPSEKDASVLERSLNVVEKLRPTFPKFSTRSMRKSMFTKFGRISTIKPSVLCCYYRDLASDSTAASNAAEEEVDKRVKQMFKNGT